HGVRLAIQSETAADDPRVSIEAAAPERLAEHDEIALAAIVLGRECAAAQCNKAQCIEHPGGNPLPGDVLTAAVRSGHHHARHVRRVAAQRDKTRALLCPVAQVEWRDIAAWRV